MKSIILGYPRIGENIEFKIGIVPKTSETIEVYDSSGIKRPTKDSDRITKMYKNSNVIITRG